MSKTDHLASLLSKTSIKDQDNEIVSFANLGKKLNSLEDGEEVAAAIKKCSNMKTLCLEGNTIGIDASKAIAKALESASQLENCQLSNIFTSRSIEEIPHALSYMVGGIMLSNTHLRELDFSDNAFGPIGVINFMKLLKSKSCYTLEVFKLNNNGLGPQGSTLVAEALSECHDSSVKAGSPFSLKVFICGRNRLENPGAIAMSKALKKIGTLETIRMTQNGIYHEGIKALSGAFAFNKNLKEINLNDNTVTAKGAKALTVSLKHLTKLETLNLGDCLLRTQGACLIASALQEGHETLQNVNLSFNEILKEGGFSLVQAMKGKTNLKSLDLNGNYFGSSCAEILGIMESFGFSKAVLAFEEDEGSELDADENEDETEEVSFHGQDNVSFTENPTAEQLKSLGASNSYSILNDVKNKDDAEEYVSLFIKYCSVIAPQNLELIKIGKNWTDVLFPEALKKHSPMIIVNYLLVHLGMLKSEEKKFKLQTKLESAVLILAHAVLQPYFPYNVKKVLQAFFNKPHPAMKLYGPSKDRLMESLFK